jgi:alcohol dehydrogenase
MNELQFLAKIHSFAIAKKILFGIGAVDRIGAEARSLGATKAFIVTDSTVVKMGLIEKVTRSLEHENIAYKIWDEAEPEPSVDNAQHAVDKLREGGPRAFDMIVGVGGGSVLDIAKTTAIVAKQPRSVKEYLGVTLPRPEIPFILVPTTAGTGSEVSNLAVLAVAEEAFKYAIYSPFMYPDVAIVDPAMSSTMPPRLTASTGVDALAHAIEAYVSLQGSPLTDVFAVEAVSLVNRHLRAAYSNGDDIEARYGMAKASLFAGFAFGNAGTVLGHAAGYAHAHIHHLPHGVSVAVTLPYVLEYNALANVEKHAHIAELLGENVAGLPVREAALRSAVAFKKLLNDLEMPVSLSEVGVKREQIPEIAERVFKSKSHVARNPRKIGREDIVKLLERAFEGKLSLE